MPMAFGALAALPYGFDVAAEVNRNKQLVAEGLITPRQAYTNLDKIVAMAQGDPKYPYVLSLTMNARGYIAGFEKVEAQQIRDQNTGIQAAVQAELRRRRESGEDQAEIDAEQEYLRRMALYNRAKSGSWVPDLDSIKKTFMPSWTNPLVWLGGGVVLWLVLRNFRKIVS